MSLATDSLTTHLLDIVRRVQRQLGEEVLTDDPSVRFADALDSMGMVEFLAILAGDCGVAPAVIEECVNRRFATIADLATALNAAGLRLRGPVPVPIPVPVPDSQPETGTWLSVVGVCLPERIQSAAEINGLLDRPAGWLESHAGIESRRLWASQDPIDAAVRAAADCLREAEVNPDAVGALLVTSEAPPLLTGLGAALHHRLGLRRDAVCLEIGNACTGFLAALWTAQALLARVGPMLVIAVEAPAQYLTLRPGPAGEAAALFGEGAVAALLCDHPIGQHPVPLAGVLLGVDGSAGDILRVERSASGPIEIYMEGPTLAGLAIRTMADAVSVLIRRHGLDVSALEAVICHGGNGRLSALLARQLGLPPERVWSETARTGNLGSVSLAAAWAAHRPIPQGPVVWVAVGAGLMWGTAISGVDWE